METAPSAGEFRAPGPPAERLAQEMKRAVLKWSAAPRGLAAYLVVHEPDFDRLKGGVRAGDILGTAFDVLLHLDPEAAAYRTWNGQ